MIPVMRIRMGASSADSTPPAPNRDQKIGSWDRFMSHPPHDDGNQDRGADRRQPATTADTEFGNGPSRDKDVRGGLGRHLPPRIGVIADRQQGQPVKEE